jgi:hypothetical protein
LNGLKKSCRRQSMGVPSRSLILAEAGHSSLNLEYLKFTCLKISF